MKLINGLAVKGIRFRIIVSTAQYRTECPLYVKIVIFKFDKAGILAIDGIHDFQDGSDRSGYGVG
jgi:hypothetical protein